MKMLDSIPIKVLLDTSVVQNLLIFGEYIYDNYLPEDLHRKLNALSNELKQDIEALRKIFRPKTRSPIVPVISMLSLHELWETPNEEKRQALLEWGFERLDYSVNVAQYDEKPMSLEQALLSDFLPDKTDRLLLGEYRRAECQAFVTMDHKTIIRYHARLRKEGINVLSPSQWWLILETYWSLWV